MHSAPAVTYPVGRCHIQTYLTLALWGLGAVVCVLWIRDVGQPGVPQGLAVLLWLLTGALALRGLLRAPVGALRWDGQQWAWQTGRDSLGGTVRPALDLQRWVVLEFRPQVGRSVWLWLARSNAPRHWGALRRALWSRVPRTAAMGSADGWPDPGQGRA